MRSLFFSGTFVMIFCFCAPLTAMEEGVATPCSAGTTTTNQPLAIQIAQLTERVKRLEHMHENVGKRQHESAADTCCTACTAMAISIPASFLVLGALSWAFHQFASI